MIKLISSELGNGSELNNSISLLLIFNHFAEISRDNEIIIDEVYRKSFVDTLIEYSDQIIFFINRTIGELTLKQIKEGENTTNTNLRNTRIDNKSVGNNH